MSTITKQQLEVLKLIAPKNDVRCYLNGAHIKDETATAANGAMFITVPLKPSDNNTLNPHLSIDNITEDDHKTNGIISSDFIADCISITTKTPIFGDKVCLINREGERIEGSSTRDYRAFKTVSDEKVDGQYPDINKFNLEADDDGLMLDVDLLYKLTTAAKKLKSPNIKMTKIKSEKGFLFTIIDDNKNENAHGLLMGKASRN